MIIGMMECKLCRLCGTLTNNYIQIFNTEGVKTKIETCLPIIVSPDTLLPDTICDLCHESTQTFYNFIKKCLENIIILEEKYSINESCLKARRKAHKSTATIEPNLNLDRRDDDDNEEELDLRECSRRIEEFGETLIRVEEELDAHQHYANVPKKQHAKLVDYDESSSDEILVLNEIRDRKRKADVILNSCPKICKLNGNRRKRRFPVKVIEEIKVKESDIEEQPIVQELAHICLLCDSQFTSAESLAGHVYEMHGIDMAQVVNNQPVPEKRKKIPNLVKITDLKQKRDSHEKPIENGEEPPTLLPTYVCPLCPASLTNKTDLFIHLRQKHATKSHLICGLCLYIAQSYLNLTDHLEQCMKSHHILNPYICKVCKYNEENLKTLENHILVHDFIINFCTKEQKIFDPFDYVEVNQCYDFATIKQHTCSECHAQFQGFKEYSTHRRAEHSIFHCDLCNKFYGRNSHLWKHVNRLHKGHPSITCQFCYKTSASKYHLAQHFNKIHSYKSPKVVRSNDESIMRTIDGVVEEVKSERVDEDEADIKMDVEDDSEAFLAQKFEPFDFQSVKQSFLREELKQQQQQQLQQAKDVTTTPISADLQCPKCAKPFHKKTLLKKHKRNCRPRSQKDLLTRCKTCSRIFKDRQSLTKHLTNYHSEYVCEICEAKVESKCEIVTHIRFQHPKCPLFCHQCENVLRCHDDMKLHLAEHDASHVCQFCGDLLQSKIKLKMHILSLHRKILSLSCGICLRLFDTQHILKQHVTQQHKDALSPLTSCTVCGKNYGSKWKTYDHLNKSHGRIFKACKTCLEVFDTDEELQQHYTAKHCSVVSSKATSPCDVEEEELCDDSASNDVPVMPTSQQPPSMTPIQQQHQYVPPPIESNKKKEAKRTVYVNSNDTSLCEICLKSWPAKKHLWQHYIRCHKQAAATCCGICLKTNKNYDTLQRHLLDNHPTLLHGCGLGSNFICRICGRYHNASSKLRLHMAIHENFNWNMIEEKQEVDGEEEVVEEEDEEEEENNPVVDDVVNYDSLIEQVECSNSSSSSSTNNSSSSSSTASDIDVAEEEEEEEEDEAFCNGGGGGGGITITDEDDEGDVSSGEVGTNCFDIQQTHEIQNAVDSIL